MPTDPIDPTHDTNGAAPQAGADTTTQEQAPAARPTTDAMRPEVLKLRLDQEHKRGATQAQEQLLSRYGVRSAEELDEKLKRMAALEETDKKRATEEEERRRSSMSSEEKLRTENEQLRAQVAALQGQLAAAESRVASMRQGAVVRSQAAEIIDPDMLDAAELKLAAHIKQLKENGEMTKLADFEKPVKIREWFRDLVAKQPKFARSETAPVAAKPPATRKPITTGAGPARAVSPVKITPTAPAGKTLKPGQKNSMSDAEAREHLAKTFPGVRIPGIA